MEQNRKQLSEQDVSEAMNRYGRTGKYSEAELKLVRADLAYGLSKEEVEVYLVRKLPMEIKRKLSEALHDGCGIEMAELLAQSDINVLQIDTAIKYYKEGVPFDTIKAVIEQNLNAHGMKEAYRKVLAQMKKVEGTGEAAFESVNKEYVDSLFEEMRGIVGKIGYDEKRFDELNEKIREISGGKISDKELDDLYQKIADKDTIINNQQDNISQANAALARLRKDIEVYEEEKKKMQETIEELTEQIDKLKVSQETVVKKEEPEGEEKEMNVVNGAVPLTDSKGNVVYGIPVHYAIGVMPEGKKEAEYSVIEKTERKTGGITSIFSKLSFKKKSRQDIVKLLASGNLTPAQLIQIRVAMEKSLTESQLLNLINNNVPADQMKEIIEIAVLENSIQ